MSILSMDISFGHVDFGLTCPGSLMQELQRDKPDQVRKIKTLQTSLAKGIVTWQCHVGCGDLSTVENFIKSIEALEELSILNFESDATILWSAIFHHGNSLKKLAIHTPPQQQARLWTLSRMIRVAEHLQQLTHIEMDLPLFQVDKALEAAFSNEPQEEGKVYRLDKLVKMKGLQSVLLNVNLPDHASTFAGKHTSGVMGCISFPEPKKQICRQFAQLVYDRFHESNPDCAMEHVEVRFPRRCWDDRAQFYTMAYSVRVRKGENRVELDEDETWKEYLPPWPTDGVLGQLVQEANNEEDWM